MQRRLTELDGLRGIASLMVVLYHYPGSFMPQEVHSFFFIRKAYTFVDFFFVLSGFVIAYNYHTIVSLRAFAVFFKKRFIRLYPMLLFSVLVYFLFRLSAIYFFPMVVDSDTTIDALVLKALDSLLFTNSTPLLGSSTGLNLPSWSISSEMISYLIFGGIALITSTRLKTGIYFVLLIASLIALFNLGTLFKLGDYGFIRGLFSFLLGYLVWRGSTFKFEVHRHLEFAVPVMVFLCLYYLSVTQAEGSSLPFEFMVPIVFGLAILLLIKSNGWLSQKLNSAPIQFLGKISYSLYLNHFLIILVVPQVIFKFLKLENNVLNQSLVFLAVMTISIVYSYLTYTHIELRFSRLLKKLLLGRTRPVEIS